MSISEAISNIQQIESQLVQISGATRTPTTAAPTSANGASFASTMDAVSGQTVTPAAGQMADNGTTGADVVADAQKYLGVPYVFGGTTSAGLDCSGLVQRVYKDLGISLPRLVSGQSTIGESVPSLADAQPGDIISCDGGNHIVIYAGNGMIIQAPKEGENVEEVKNWITPDNVVSIRRIVPSQSAQAAPATGSTQLSALQSLLGSSGSAGALSGLLGSSPSSSLLSTLLAGSGSTNGLGAIAAILGENTELAAMSTLMGNGSSSSSSASSTSSLGGNGTSSLLAALMAGGLS